MGKGNLFAGNGFLNDSYLVMAVLKFFAHKRPIPFVRNEILSNFGQNNTTIRFLINIIIHRFAKIVNRLRQGKIKFQLENFLKSNSGFTICKADYTHSFKAVFLEEMYHGFVLFVGVGAY